MRKGLLATTAILGFAALTAPAQAQITVTLGGYTEFFAGFYDDDRPNRTDREFELETEIVVRADGKADNGLLYGTKVELQNAGNGTSATGIVTDEASVYLAGGWGRFELGDFDGAADTLKIYAPVIGIEQIDGDYTDFSTFGDFGGFPTFGVHIPNSGDSTKIMYLTPRIAGFQAGASYAPENGDEAQSVVKSKNSSTYKDFMEFGVNYTGEFSGFGVALGGTVSMADSATNSGVKDFTAWNLGGQVTFGNFAFGGGYVDADDFNAPTGVSEDQSVWHVGASYTVGPLAVAATYADAEGYKSIGGLYAPDYKSYGLGATYTLAPGMILESDLMFFDEDVRPAAGGANTSNDGYVFVVGTRLDF